MGVQGGPPFTTQYPGAMDSNPKEDQRVVNNIVADMGASEGQDAFVGLFTDPRGQLSWRSDPVWFAHELEKIMASVPGSVWTMPVDMESADEIDPSRPQSNTLLHDG